MVPERVYLDSSDFVKKEAVNIQGLSFIATSSPHLCNSFINWSIINYFRFLHRRAAVVETEQKVR